MKFFLLGAAGYPVLELIARGRTHPSMALAGGLSMVLIHRINKQMNAPLSVKALACAGGITAIEAACGMVWNRHHQVWDYTHVPLNWRGQICLPYFGVWTALSTGALLLDKALDRA